MALVSKAVRDLAGRAFKSWQISQPFLFTSQAADQSRGTVPSFSVHSEEFKAWQKDSDKDAVLLVDGLANQDLALHSLKELRARSDLEVCACQHMLLCDSILVSIHGHPCI